MTALPLTEKIDLPKLHYLNDLSFDDFKPLCSGKNIKEKEIKFNLLKKYTKEMIQCNGTINRTYSHSLNSKLGRLFCGGSIQGLSKNLRGFLIFSHNRH